MKAPHRIRKFASWALLAAGLLVAADPQAQTVSAAKGRTAGAIPIIARETAAYGVAQVMNYQPG